jgi:MSHA biogenesis protein MshP
MSRKLSKYRKRCNLPENQSGAGLPIALFIVTVLSLIVLGMSQLQESSGNAISLQIQSQRAFFAAESGAQVVMADIMPEDNSLPVSCPASLPVDISFSEAGLSNCTASVSCDDDYDPVITLKSTGKCGSGQETASRIVEVRAR